MLRRKKRARNEGVVVTFLGGVIIGLLVSLPIAAWLAPRSGRETRREIAQTGMIIRHKVSDNVRKPIEQVQDQIDHLRGESVEESLAEGRALAAQRRASGGFSEH